MNNLPLYKGRDPVRAAKIVDTYPEGIRNTKLELQTPDGASHIVGRPPEWFDRHQPKEGGFLVVMDGGYQLFMSAVEFNVCFAPVVDVDFLEVGEALPCPCCGAKAMYTKADKHVRMPDLVACLSCDLQIESDDVGAALRAWNKRTVAP